MYAVVNFEHNGRWAICNHERKFIKMSCGRVYFDTLNELVSQFSDDKIEIETCLFVPGRKKYLYAFNTREELIDQCVEDLI